MTENDGWLPIETAPDGEWIIGKLAGSDRPPAFVGKKYDDPFHRDGDEPHLALIDPWSGKWKVVIAWMPLPSEQEDK